MEKLNRDAVHLFDSLDAAAGELKINGAHRPMLRLFITVNRQSRLLPEPQIFQLPELWVAPETAADLATAIQAALWRFHPEKAQALGIARPTPPEGSGPHS